MKQISLEDAAHLLSAAVAGPPPVVQPVGSGRRRDTVPGVLGQRRRSGIPPEERSKVFGRFYRILGTGKSGSGLGLAIVERIARAHGATISLTDGEKKRGLHVKVAFPSAP